MAFYYKKIPEFDVEPRIRERARAMLDFCQKKLGLSGIRIEWVRKAEEAEFKIDALLVESEQKLRHLIKDHSEIETSYNKWKEEFWGLTQIFGAIERNKINVRADIQEWEILQTVAHECKHVRDGQLYRPSFTEQEKMTWEQRAEAFASDAIREFSCSST